MSDHKHLLLTSDETELFAFFRKHATPGQYQTLLSKLQGAYDYSFKKWVKEILEKNQTFITTRSEADTEQLFRSEEGTEKLLKLAKKCKYLYDNAADMIDQTESDIDRDYLNEQHKVEFRHEFKHFLGAYDVETAKKKLIKIYKIIFNTDNENSKIVMSDGSEKRLNELAISDINSIDALITLEKDEKAGSTIKKSPISLSPQQKNDLYQELGERPALLKLVKKCHVFAEAKQILKPQTPVVLNTKEILSDRIEDCRAHLNKNLPLLTEKREHLALTFFKALGLGLIIFTATIATLGIAPALFSSIGTGFGWFDTKSQIIAENLRDRVANANALKPK